MQRAPGSQPNKSSGVFSSSLLGVCSSPASHHVTRDYLSVFTLCSTFLPSLERGNTFNMVFRFFFFIYKQKGN